MDDRADGCLTCALVVIFLLILMLMGGCVVANFSSVTYVEGTITGTPVQNGETYFAVKLDNGTSEIFENEDNWTHGKTNAGDYLLVLENGKHYRFKVNWYRFQLLSMYRNIISYELTP